MTRSKGPVRVSFFLRGIVILIPRWRQYRLILPLLYPLSPTTRLGLLFGRPRPNRLIAPVSIRDWKVLASCCWPGVTRSEIGLPPPSALRCTLVLNPPRLRPSPSLAESPLLRLLHVGGLARWYHQRSESPSQFVLRHRQSVAHQPRYDPRRLPCASDKSDWQWFPKAHNVQANLAKERRCEESRECRLRRDDGRRSDVQYAVFRVEGAVSASPTARYSSLLCA